MTLDRACVAGANRPPPNGSGTRSPSSGVARFDLGDDGDDVLDGAEVAEGLDDAVDEGYVLVDEDVPKTREAFEAGDDVGREALARARFRIASPSVSNRSPRRAESPPAMSTFDRSCLEAPATGSGGLEPDRASRQRPPGRSMPP